MWLLVSEISSLSGIENIILSFGCLLLKIFLHYLDFQSFDFKHHQTTIIQKRRVH